MEMVRQSFESAIIVQVTRDVLKYLKSSITFIDKSAARRREVMWYCDIYSRTV
jgi:hypothetical protein